MRAVQQKQKSVAVIGQGYVGLPLALQAVRAGFQVIGLEVDEQRVARLLARHSYVEDVSDLELQEAFDCGRYRVSPDFGDAEGFDIAVISVPTPLTGGEPDLSAVIGSATTLAPLIKPGAVVILESTTYPGTTEDVVAPLLEQGSGLKAGRDFALGYSPERIDPGNATWTFAKTPKLVSGVNEYSQIKVKEFFDTIVEHTVVVSGTREAELAKLMENTFRSVNIALVNETAMFAADMGIDIWEAIRAAGTKPFGYMAFTPGPGVGGHCLPIDPIYLDWLSREKTGRPLGFVNLANDINRGMPGYVVQRIGETLKKYDRVLADSRVLLLGLAYKANTADLRESPAMDVALKLLEAGVEVRAVDPHATPGTLDPRIEIVQLTADELASADVTVLLTDHDCFDYDLIESASQHVFDTRNRLRNRAVERI
ncbi:MULTISPECIES: nucleotide sugar dehydrogenase [unclassified Streptomyces]|uniref:nucleotide sugar dehydrogenase n=1 Tax=unclassified Streptomyces TaxID=2593676 RepID=UPI002E294A67|nr:nucleotide sugar dehydrogenase [Streptomyces sp. NBC_01439]